MIYNPEYKGIRLDVYARDEKNTQKKICGEISNLTMEDGAHTIYLSTKGTNDDEVSPELVRFLKFVESPLQDSEKDFNDDFIRKLQSSVKEVKASREMGTIYMTFEEFIKEERLEERMEERMRIARKMLEKGIQMEEIAVYIDLTEDQFRELLEENEE